MFREEKVLIMQSTLSLVLLLICFVFWPFGVATSHAAEAEFCGAPDEPSNISALIPVIKQGNFPDFARTNAIARERLVYQLSDMSMKLFSVRDMPATEVQSLYTFFSDFHDYMTNAADEGIGNALSARIPAEIERLYREVPVPYRKIRFSLSNTQPSQLSQGQYFMYGTYSVMQAGQIALTLNVVNTSLGEQRAFSSIGEPAAAVVDVSRQIFDSFQAPGSPNFHDPLPGRTWLVLPSTLAGGMLEASSAEQLCVSQQARLPTRHELEVAYAFGQYYSGVQIQRRAVYVVLDEAGRLSLFNIESNRCIPDEDTSENLGLVLCIRDE
jgi:hypothetical protein